MASLQPKEQAGSKSVRLSNKLRILNHLYWNSGETQLGLSHSLGLSFPTLYQSLQQFKECGLLLDGEEKESSGGRKPREILFHYGAFHSIGVEIRRQQVRIVVVNLKGDVVHALTEPLVFFNQSDYWTRVDGLIQTLVSQLPQVKKVLGIGIAFPGELSGDKLVIERSTVLGITHEPLVNLRSCFHAPVKIEYGANTAGFGAVWQVREIMDAVYLIVTDNGIAGSIIINNQVFSGSASGGTAGAFGHMVLNPNGKRCFCGGTGCWATYCALSNLYDEAHPELDDFFRLLEAENQDCADIWGEYLAYFAQALSNIKLSLDMNIIIGGKLAPYLKPYLPDLNRKINEYPALHESHKFISLDDSGENAQAIGAALMFTDDLLSGRAERFLIE